jgi:hypothetical protein
MSRPTERWLLAWLVTLVVAPYGFTALVTLIVAAAPFVQGVPSRDLITSMVSLISSSFRNFVYTTMTLAAGPTLLFGVPATILLERRRAMSFSAFAMTGAIVGALAAPLLLMALKDFAVPPGAAVAALFGAAYGCFTALTFRLFRGPAAAA